MGELSLYLGGAKSGKTRLAMAEASTHPPQRIYLATAEARDGEMVSRIKNHQAERGTDWRTVEAPLDPAAALAAQGGAEVVMIDCLTLWLNNLLAQTEDYDEIMGKVNELSQAIEKYAGPVILVSNEVGGGIVPMNALARKFRDLSGQAHQILAAQAKKVVMVIAGLPLILKS